NQSIDRVAYSLLDSVYILLNRRNLSCMVSYCLRYTINRLLLRCNSPINASHGLTKCIKRLCPFGFDVVYFSVGVFWSWCPVGGFVTFFCFQVFVFYPRCKIGR